MEQPLVIGISFIGSTIQQHSGLCNGVATDDIRLSINSIATADYQTFDHLNPRSWNEPWVPCKNCNSKQ
jgi:hypothetical protein